MSLENALTALKNHDFVAALVALAAIPPKAHNLPFYLAKGLAEISLEKWKAAAVTFTAATQLFPDQALLWLNRGMAEENLGQIDDAIASQEKCLSLNPTQAEAFGNLSNLYRKKNQFSEAEDMARRALENGASAGNALNCLGLALDKQGKFVEAESAFHQAHLASQDDPAILANMANMFLDQLQFDKAWKLFAEARGMRNEPVFRHDEALGRLLSGDFTEGWNLFDARLEMPNALRLHTTYPRWHGEKLAGKKLLIIAEQGFGDVIHMCRYHSLIIEGELVWAVPASLVNLLSGWVRGTVLDEKWPLPTCDFYVPILSLPLATGYLTPLPLQKKLTVNSPAILPEGKKVKKIGIAWTGSPTHGRDHERSIPLEKFVPLLKAANADFYAPFTGEALEQIGDLPIIRLNHLIHDFADTAALLKQLDCLITVDTAIAHLAGSIGVTTYLLLPHCPDWRWGVGDDKTPLYPSITILRQPTYGDWDSVISLLERRFRETA